MASQRDLVWDQLAEGKTDKEIAHCLGLHHSSVRRTIAILMRDNAVGNRIALAIKHPKFTGTKNVAD